MSASELVDSTNAAAGSALELKEEERLTLLVACERLKLKLENPGEATFRVLFAVRRSSLTGYSCQYAIGC